MMKTGIGTLALIIGFACAGPSDSGKKSLGALCAEHGECSTGFCIDWGNGKLCSRPDACASDVDCAGAFDLACRPIDGRGTFCVPAAEQCVPQCGGRECGDNGCEGSCGECPQDRPLCNTRTGTCVSECAPDCTGRDCGDDGCNGNCGSCPQNSLCDLSGRCIAECVPDCDGKECGDDGCNGSCGSCPEDRPMCNTVTGLCVSECTPDCAGRDCGDDGCNGSCGNCPQGKQCNESGICDEVCVPDCDGKDCGDNGCEGSCGSCPQGKACNEAGRCIDIPRECPAEGCPAGTYCDLAENVCVPGCIHDEDCAANEICESRQCRVGCRRDADCPIEKICANLQCVTGCNGNDRCPQQKICDPAQQVCRAGCRLDSMAVASSVDLESFGVDWTFMPEFVEKYGNFAYLGESSDSGVCILDVSNSDAPDMSGQFDAAWSWIEEMRILGSRFYAAAGGDFRVHDLSNPASPQAVGWYSLDEGGIDGMAVSAGMAYLVATKQYWTEYHGYKYDARFVIIDTANLEAITLKSEMALGEGFNSFHYTIAEKDGKAFIAIPSEVTLIVVDVSNPSSPSLTAEMRDEALKSFDVDGDYLFGLSEEGGGRVVDISNPSSPRLAGTFEATGRRLKARGDFLYVAAEDGGLQVFNIEDPEHPFLSGSVTVSDRAFDVTLDGQYAYIADYAYGLTIVRLPACAGQ